MKPRHQYYLSRLSAPLLYRCKASKTYIILLAYAEEDTRDEKPVIIDHTASKQPALITVPCCRAD